ncbi:hypothetical protein [Streptomyces sp. DG1A-41]|uniref:hypothetical protein n=1 Tax=Streptomyces sp. DG1A-41 TaxID=3125779 RepID=UPI0030CE270F
MRLVEHGLHQTPVAQVGVAVRDRGEPVAEEDTQGIDDLAALGVVRGVGRQDLAVRTGSVTT